MNKLLISAGVAAGAVSILATAPAQAGTLTFGAKADASLQIDFSLLLAGRDFGGTTVPNSLKVAADDVTGSFIVLDDPAQITDGNIELDENLVNALLGEPYEDALQSFLGDFGFTSDQALQAADDVFTIIGFNGGGVVEAKAPALAGNPGNPSSFDIFYKGFGNPLLIDGYDSAVAESCVSNTCVITGNVSFGVGVVLSELVSLTGELLANPSLALSAEDRDTIATLQQTATFAQLFGPTLSLATVNADLSATTEFLASNPDGTADDTGADVTGGLVTATATVGTQEEEIFSQSLASPSAVVEPAVAAKSEAAVEPTVVPEPVAAEPVVKPAIAAPAVASSVVLEVPTVVNSSNPPTVVNKAAVAGGSVEITPGPIALVTADSTDAQDVPEPSILLGLLGTALAIKHKRKQKASQ